MIIHQRHNVTLPFVSTEILFVLLDMLAFNLTKLSKFVIKLLPLLTINVIHEIKY